MGTIFYLAIERAVRVDAWEGHGWSRVAFVRLGKLYEIDYSLEWCEPERAPAPSEAAPWWRRGAPDHNGDDFGCSRGVLPIGDVLNWFERRHALGELDSAARVALGALRVAAAASDPLRCALWSDQ